MKMNFVGLTALSAFALALVCAQGRLQADAVVTTITTGLVSEATPDDIVIRTEADPAPIHYFVSRHTEYVDEKGIPVASSLVRAGDPVTISYVREGDRMIVRQVVVSKAAMPAPLREKVIERDAAVTQTPEVIRKRVYVDHPGVEPIERGVYIERPLVEDKTVVIEKPAVVERRVTVAPGIVVEKKTVTTTTDRFVEDKTVNEKPAVVERRVTVTPTIVEKKTVTTTTTTGPQ